MMNHQAEMGPFMRLAAPMRVGDLSAVVLHSCRNRRSGQYVSATIRQIGYAGPIAPRETYPSAHRHERKYPPRHSMYLARRSVESRGCRHDAGSSWCLLVTGMACPSHRFDEAGRGEGLGGRGLAPLEVRCLIWLPGGSLPDHQGFSCRQVPVPGQGLSAAVSWPARQ